jgi:predicted alpha/beta-hydrolase family hydrolase
VKARTEHWPAIGCPTLFLEGTRDSLCDLPLLESLLPQLAGPCTLKVIDGGDHSFKIPKSLNKSQESVFAEMMTTALDWMGHLGHS